MGRSCSRRVGVGREGSRGVSTIRSWTGEAEVPEGSPCQCRWMRGRGLVELAVGRLVGSRRCRREVEGGRGDRRR